MINYLSFMVILTSSGNGKFRLSVSILKTNCYEIKIAIYKVTLVYSKIERLES